MTVCSHRQGTTWHNQVWNAQSHNHAVMSSRNKHSCFYFFSLHLILGPGAADVYAESDTLVDGSPTRGQTGANNLTQSLAGTSDPHSIHSQCVRGIVRRNKIIENHSPSPCGPETLWLRPLLEKTEAKKSEGGEYLVPQGLRTNFQFRCLQMLKIPLSKGGQGRSEDPKTCVVLCSYTLG